jgi:hypothetical protein
VNKRVNKFIKKVDGPTQMSRRRSRFLTAAAENAGRRKKRIDGPTDPRAGFVRRASEIEDENENDDEDDIYLGTMSRSESDPLEPSQCVSQASRFASN